ncbi:MAG TPA: glycosyltransferase family 2 protein [Candidatus Acidoferrales bacterium]|nr:glycosyltransferase family 2 protein [Candidatus Acidoferrales bacterium]
MSLPLVTIAIPTYNRAGSYLREALDCALGQTYENLEVIVADNCSSDGTRALVGGIQDRRLRYFRHRANIGANDNFNFCFSQARGKYVLLLHDDDKVDFDFVQACIEAAAGRSPGVIRTGVRLIDAQGRLIHEVPNRAAGLSTEEFFRAWFAVRTPIYLCNTLFNTGYLREIGGFRSKHNCYQDTMAIVRLAAEYGRVDIADVKASFRQHSGEMALKRTMREWCEDSLILLKLMCDLAKDNRAMVLRSGRRFFARANYRRASMADSPIKRLRAYVQVWRHFNYRYLPSASRLVQLLAGTRLLAALRTLKRNLASMA